ncbi:MAG: adenylosuccinate lyase [Nitrospinota bacterium]|nr:adenylosuccinate lyase [Nitrospinota bacterium]
MISRYTREEMASIWSDQNRYKTWLRVELAACEAYNEMGEIPDDALKTIKEKAAFEPERVQEIEATVKHDVIAFLTNVAEHVGPVSRYIHMGLTSSDVLDTALSLQMLEASDIILKDLKRLSEVLKKRALEHKNTPMIGRSHGIHAEPTTFGLKLALWYAECQRNLTRMETARETIRVGQISGAVGTYGNIDPKIEEYVCKKCGLKVAPISTQVIQRDRHAEFMTTLALIAGMIEKISVEIRHLQRTEVLEAEEFFSKGQKGSSAMPHKRNPIVSEQMTGLSRIIRGNAMAALENIPLWHERDISHSSVERIILPDSTILINYMLFKTTNLIENLIVYPENMMRNLEMMGGLIYSESILLALVRKGLTREDAYRLVQKEAMKVWEKGEDFKTLILNEKTIMSHISKDDVEKIFNLEKHLSKVDTIFARVFGVN